MYFLLFVFIFFFEFSLSLYGLNADYQIQIVMFQVDLLRGQKTDKVDVTIQPEELEVMDDVLAAKYDVSVY